MKALFVADLHIKLGQKNVPKDWQINRFKELAKSIDSEPDIDYVIIGGDLLDVAKPSYEEVGLMYDFLSEINKDKILIPGNHEMVTKTKDCFEPLTKLLDSTNTRVIRNFETFDNIDYIPYNIIHNKKLPTKVSDFCVTHVRGAIPPHVKPEIDLSLLKDYTTVFAGDLHSNENSQLNIAYPGSPFNTSFHRGKPKGCGVFIIDTETGKFEWKSYNLPSLIRTSVSKESEIVNTDPDHTVYELIGNLKELSEVGNSELLEKKLAVNVSTPATLELSGNLPEELQLYFTKVKKYNPKRASELVDVYNSYDNT